MFNKETGKRHFFTFPGNGCKEEKKCFINGKKIATSRNLYFDKKDLKVKKIPLEFLDYLP